MVLEKLDTHMQKKKKDLDTDFTPYIKINTKWIIDLHIKCKITKLVEDNI